MGRRAPRCHPRGSGPIKGEIPHKKYLHGLITSTAGTTFRKLLDEIEISDDITTSKQHYPFLDVGTKILLYS